MQQQIGALKDDLSKREQALRSITGKVSLALDEVLKLYYTICHFKKNPVSAFRKG